MQVKAWQSSVLNDCPRRPEPLVRRKDHLREVGAGRALRTKFVWWTALPLLLTVPAVAGAQTTAPLPAPAAITPPDQIIEFSADSVAYDLSLIHI